MGVAPPEEEDGCIIDNLLKEIRSGTTLKSTGRKGTIRKKTSLTTSDLSKLNSVMAKASAASPRTSRAPSRTPSLDWEEGVVPNSSFPNPRSPQQRAPGGDSKRKSLNLNFLGEVSTALESLVEEERQSPHSQPQATPTVPPATTVEPSAKPQVPPTTVVVSPNGNTVTTPLSPESVPPIITSDQVLSAQTGMSATPTYPAPPAPEAATAVTMSSHQSEVGISQTSDGTSIAPAARPPGLTTPTDQPIAIHHDPALSVATPPVPPTTTNSTVMSSSPAILPPAPPTTASILSQAPPTTVSASSAPPTTITTNGDSEITSGPACKSTAGNGTANGTSGSGPLGPVQTNGLSSHPEPVVLNHTHQEPPQSDRPITANGTTIPVKDKSPQLSRVRTGYRVIF